MDHSFLEESITGGHSFLEESITGGHSFLEELITGGHSFLEESITGGHSFLEESITGGHSRCSFQFCRPGTAKSQYRSYLDYVRVIGQTMGFEVQEDIMRIPSSKRVWNEHRVCVNYICMTL